MTLFRIKAAPVILIEDIENINSIPLILELAGQEKVKLHFFSYEQPISLWTNVFKQSNVVYHEEFEIDAFDKYTCEKCTIIIDSVNQMALSLGWYVCINTLKRLIKSPNVNQVILNLHLDSLFSSSKIRINLNHIANAVISYDMSNSSVLHILLKKGGKVIKSDETISYDTKSSTLRLTPIIKEKGVEEETEKLLPQNLCTFKIEVDQTEKLEKYKLQLPYMNKINEGESKIYYEPDAVDDWDEEDPDDDLDI